MADELCIVAGCHQVEYHIIHTTKPYGTVMPSNRLSHEFVKPKVPELRHIGKQCEDTAERILGGPIRCQREYGHAGRHRSLRHGWDNEGPQGPTAGEGPHGPPQVSELVGNQVPMSIAEWQKACYKNSRDHGFHDQYLVERDEDINSLFICEKLALIHSEVSECLECVRDGQMEERTSVTDNPTYDNHGLASRKPEGFPSELADVVIRCLDLADMLGIDLEGAMRRKHEYNKTRPYKHGKKF